MPDWAIWLTLGIVLLAFEVLIAFTLYAGPVALGAFLAAAAAALGYSVEVQVGTFAVGAALSLAFVRPVARRHMTTPPPVRTGTAALVGRHADVTSTVTDGGGEVRIRGGQVWSARSEPGVVLEPGTEVEVVDVRGVSVLVRDAAQAAASPADADPAPEGEA